MRSDEKEREITQGLLRAAFVENENVTFAGRYNKDLGNQSAKASTFEQELGEPGLLC